MTDTRILFLTLRVFSATGGIEKVCRVAGKSFVEMFQSGTKIFSVYDKDNEVAEKYIPLKNFRGFNNSKLKFILAAVLEGRKADVVILSHINLVLVGFLIKLFSPSTKLVLFAHGIEIWGPLSSFRRRMLHRCSLILAVSNFTKEVMAKNYKLAEEKIRVLNNCLDPFLPLPVNGGKNERIMKACKINANDFVLLTLTRLSSKEQYKGYDHVLFSLKQLGKKYPGLKYLMVGKYDAAEKVRLDKIIASLCLEDAVHFTGYIPDEELAAHYKLADLYVMPSKKEGFGIVFIEALHYGLPVIAGNKDGSVDALCNGKLGILIDPDNQEELTDKIEMVIRNKNEYLPSNDVLMNEFSFPVYKKKLQNIFYELIKKQVD